MLGFPRKLDRTNPPHRRHRRNILTAEALEPRLLLYSTLGDLWTYDSRITISFMPDGTSIGGVPSSLFQTLNAIAPTSSWQQQIEGAATLWENVTNVNFSVVSDNGEPLGAPGYQQGDPNVGDIRIGAAPLGAGTLAMTFLPPPANGGTDAGDIILNSQADWGINTNYDLMTVAAHEFGHALGLGGSTYSTAVMYETYNGLKQALTSDDIAGIQAVYGPRQYDQFNQNGTRNIGYPEASNITSYINASAQITLPNLNLTYAGDAEWYKVTVPTDTIGTMDVTVQSSNLSLLSPKLMIYSSSISLLGSTWAPASMGATISYPLYNVTPGEEFYIKVMAAPGIGPVGAYGLLVNFGSQSQAAVPPPYTMVASQPDQGSGTATPDTSVQPLSNPAVGPNGYVPPLPQYAMLGSLGGWVLGMSPRSSSPQSSGITPNSSTSTRLGIAPLIQSGSTATSPTSTLITTLASMTTVTPPTKVSTRPALVATPAPAPPPKFYGSADIVIDHHRPSSGRRGKLNPFDYLSKRFD